MRDEHDEGRPSAVGSNSYLIVAECFDLRGRDGATDGREEGSSREEEEEEEEEDDQELAGY